MTSRRDFLKTSVFILAGLTAGANAGFMRDKNAKVFTTRRPLLKDRKFVSKSIENIINEVKNNVKNDKLVWMFEN
jgi:hypothetical protein